MQFKKKSLPASVDELNTRQAEFVTSYIEMGGKKGCEVEAALQAGYGGGVREKAKRQATALLKNPHVLAAIKAEMTNHFGAASVLAVNVLVDLAQNGPPNVRLKAAQDILDRGVGPVVRTALPQEQGDTIDDILDILLQEEQKQKESNAIEAEFVTVAPASLPLHRTKADKQDQ